MADKAPKELRDALERRNDVGSSRVLAPSGVAGVWITRKAGGQIDTLATGSSSYAPGMQVPVGWQQGSGPGAILVGGLPGQGGFSIAALDVVQTVTVSRPVLVSANPSQVTQDSRRDIVFSGSGFQSWHQLKAVINTGSPTYQWVTDERVIVNSAVILGPAEILADVTFTDDFEIPDGQLVPILFAVHGGGVLQKLLSIPAAVVFVGPKPEFLGYFHEGSTLRMISMGLTGVYNAEIGAAPASTFLWQRAIRIPTDQSDTLQPDSVVWSNGQRFDADTEGSSGVWVADLRAGVEYSLTSGFVGEVGVAGYWSGFVWFLTWGGIGGDDLTQTFRLYKVAPDLDPLTLTLEQTKVVTADTLGFPLEWRSSNGWGLSANGRIFCGSVDVISSHPEGFLEITGSAYFDLGGAMIDGFGGSGERLQVGAPMAASFGIAGRYLQPGTPQVEEVSIGWEQRVTPNEDWWPGEEFPTDPFSYDIIGSWPDPNALRATMWIPEIQRLAIWLPTTPVPSELDSQLQIEDHPLHGRAAMICPV